MPPSCLLLFCCFFSLGAWQLDRAEQKKQQKAQIDTLANLPPVSLNDSKLLSNTEHDALSPYQRVLLTGQFIAKDQFLLDNIIRGGKPGYYLISPFLIEDTQRSILVNRGWIAQGKSRQILPTFETPTERITLKGVLSEPRSKPVILGSIDHPVSDTPPLWYYMDIKVFEQEAGYRVLPLIIKPDPDATSTLVRDWPKFEAKSGMHIGYAIQWFVFALFVLIAFLGLSIKKTITDQAMKNNP